MHGSHDHVVTPVHDSHGLGVNRGVDYHMPAHQWHVNIVTGLVGVFIFHQSRTVPAGLYTLKSDESKHLLSATFIFCLLSRLGISVHIGANSFDNISLLLFGLCSNQPSAKKQRGEKKESKSGT